MKENVLVEKSLRFGARILKLYQYLVKTKKETIISKQIVRSGTSIGANINEANYAQSRADFINKLEIALKECSETEYWIEMLVGAKAMDANQADKLMLECGIIRRMLVKSLNTAKNPPR